MTQVTVTHSDGSTDTIPQTLGWTRRREIGKMRRATIDVDRDDAQAANLVPKQDTVALGDIDTLRLVDIEKGGPTWSLVTYSHRWDANAVEPTPGGDLREGTDQEIITELVSEVPSWSVGTIENHTGPLNFVLNHAKRHEALWRVEQNVPGETRFRDGGTVDYVENRGSDKTEDVTLSAAAGNIEKEISITNRGRELDGTHIRVVGAHEGEAQLFANLVPSDDPATYENRVDYDTGRWDPGDTRSWDRISNKDVSDQATIEEEAATIGEEITEGLVEAKATVSGVDIDVGDWVHVAKPRAGIDRDLRVHRIKTVTEGAKTVDEVLLSTRTTVRKGDSQEYEDISRYNVAFEGSSITLQGGGDRQPVSDSLNAVVPFRYPDVDYEHAAELQVRGLPYRALSSGALQDDTDTELQDSFIWDGVEWNDGETKTATLTVAEDWSNHPILFHMRVGLNNDTDPHGFGSEWQAQFVTSGVTEIGAGHERVYQTGEKDTQGTLLSLGYFLQVYDSIPYVFNGSDIDIHITNQTGHDFVESGGDGTHKDDEDITVEVAFFNVRHSHPPDPGIIESFPNIPEADGNDLLHPSGCDVIVNGSTAATDIGSGEFETVVDITDDLNAGEWNTVEISSDSLGHVLATPYLEAYKRIGGGG